MLPELLEDAAGALVFLTGVCPFPPALKRLLPWLRSDGFPFPLPPC